jgi:hypothetical protein
MFWQSISVLLCPQSEGLCVCVVETKCFCVPSLMECVSCNVCCAEGERVRGGG